MSTQIKNPRRRQRRQARGSQNPTISQIEGHGGYYTDKIAPFMRSVIPDGTFSRYGKAAGGMLGARTGLPGAPLLGAAGGGFLGGKISKLLGFGDYVVESNTLSKSGMAVPEGTPIPAFGNIGHETKISHREYIGELLVPTNPTAFNITSYAINAGNSALFPWLASMAANFQQYRFNGLVIEFRTLSSDITAGGALGSVILATNYDVVEGSFASKIAMENSEYAVSCKPSCSQLHAVECAPKLTSNNVYYVRDGTTITATTDNRFYDLGNFQVATQGLPSTAGTVLGELWASYDVSLLKPQIGIPSGSVVQHSTFTGVDAATIFGTASASIGGTLVTYLVNMITILRPGSYLIEIVNIGTVFQTYTLAGSATTTSFDQAGPRPGTITHQITCFVATTTLPNQTVVINSAGTATITSTVVNVTPVSGNWT